MNIKRIINKIGSPSFFKFNKRDYEGKIAKDEVFNARFRNGGVTLSRKGKESLRNGELWLSIVNTRLIKATCGAISTKES